MEREKTSSDQSSWEGKELTTTELQLWAGGLLELSGYMGFAKRKERSGNSTVLPIVTIQDENLAVIQTVQRLFKGSSYPARNGKTFRWEAKRQPAIEVAKLIQHTAPSRKTVVNFFLKSEYLSPVTKLELYEEFNQTLPYSPTQEGYIPLVTSPLFMAGLIDRRGVAIATLEDDRLQIKSPNKSLLTCVAAIWGGAVHPNYLKGETSNVGTATVDSYRWIAGIADAKKILTATAAYRQLKTASNP